MPHKDPQKRKEWQKRYSSEHREQRRAVMKRYNEKYHILNKDMIADKLLQKLYGITLTDKQAMCNSQSGKCANKGCTYLFKSLSDAHVDHNHSTGQVRGLLCRPCNTALGFLSESQAKILGLEEYRSKWDN